MKQPALGKKILELRTQKGLTQEELVEQCNISVRTIQRIEAGEVTPRIFTIKTILNVLEYPLEKFQESPTETKFKELLLLKLDNSKHASFLTKQLSLAWICGIIYLVFGFLEFPADAARLYENEMIFATPIYVIIKLIGITSFVFFMRGFILLGTLFNNYFLKIIAFIFIFINVAFYAFALLTLAIDMPENYDALLIAQAIVFGVVGILLGVAIIRLTKNLGTIAMVTGIFELVTYTLFATIIFVLGGFILLIPTLILEIILLYKALKMIEEKQKEFE